MVRIHIRCMGCECVLGIIEGTLYPGEKLIYCEDCANKTLPDSTNANEVSYSKKDESLDTDSEVPKGTSDPQQVEDKGKEQFLIGLRHELVTAFEEEHINGYEFREILITEKAEWKPDPKDNKGKEKEYCSVCGGDGKEGGFGVFGSCDACNGTGLKPDPKDTVEDTKVGEYYSEDCFGCKWWNEKDNCTHKEPCGDLGLPNWEERDTKDL